MKKIIFTGLIVLLMAGNSFATSFYWDFTGTDYAAIGTGAGSVTPVQIIDVNTDWGMSSATGTLTRIYQNLGGDGILNDFDTFKEFGMLNQVDVDNQGISFLNTDTGEFVNIFLEFSGLEGSIFNYDNGIDLLDTTLANFGTALIDDSFDLIFTPGVGTIRLYIDDQSTSSQLDLAFFSLLAGEGTSPQFIVNQLEGQFGFVGSFDSVRPTTWFLTDGTAFEDVPLDLLRIFSTNLGATLKEAPALYASIPELGGLAEEGILFQVENEGSLAINVIPEPSTLLLLGAGLLGLSFYGRRKKS